jgi:hypothetical protein
MSTTGRCSLVAENVWLNPIVARRECQLFGRTFNCSLLNSSGYFSRRQISRTTLVMIPICASAKCFCHLIEKSEFREAVCRTHTSTWESQSKPENRSGGFEIGIGWDKPLRSACMLEKCQTDVNHRLIDR